VQGPGTTIEFYRMRANGGPRSPGAIASEERNDAHVPRPASAAFESARDRFSEELVRRVGAETHRVKSC
jgi:hypothetical protein